MNIRGEYSVVHFEGKKYKFHVKAKKTTKFLAKLQKKNIISVYIHRNQYIFYLYGTKFKGTSLYIRRNAFLMTYGKLRGSIFFNINHSDL